MILGSVIGINNSSNHESFVYYGVCSTAGDVSPKQVNINNFQLINHTHLVIRFNNDNSFINPTLQINTNASKQIYYKNTNVPANLLKANILYDFIYHDNIFELIGPIDNPMIIPCLSTSPLSPVNGLLYYNTEENKLYIYNNNWIAINN